MERAILEREIRRVPTSLGEAAVKLCSLYGSRRIYPEYESVAAICKQKGLSYQEVYRRVSEEACFFFEEGEKEACPENG